MSATYKQRVFRWGIWFASTQRPGLQVVGFEHQCGGATLVDFTSDDFSTCCAACRHEVQRPTGEARALYRPEPPRPAHTRATGESRVTTRDPTDTFLVTIDGRRVDFELTERNLEGRDGHHRGHVTAIDGRPVVPGLTIDLDPLTYSVDNRTEIPLPTPTEWFLES